MVLRFFPILLIQHLESAYYVLGLWVVRQHTWLEVIHRLEGICTNTQVSKAQSRRGTLPHGAQSRAAPSAPRKFQKPTLEAGAQI